MTTTVTGELEITSEQAEWLHRQSLFVATPAIDGRVHSSHYFSKLVLQELLKKYRIRCRFLDKPGDSLVTRARNKLANQFIKSAMSHMLLIDSDISFQPPDVIQLLLLSQTYEGIIGVPYPKKQVNWERIAKACNHESQHPIELMPAIGSDFVLNPLDIEEWNRDGISLSKPQPMRHLGTGYLLLPHYVFEHLSEAGRIECRQMEILRHQQLTEDDKNFIFHWINRRGPVVDEYILSKEEQRVEGQERMKSFFEGKVSCEIDKDGNLVPELVYYPSEDWWFCDRYREIGGKVWGCCWMRSVHHGSYEYIGDMPSIAKVEEAL